MYKYEEVDKATFFSEVLRINYRADDVKEAKEFGCQNIEICYKKTDKRLAKYFVIYYDTEPICTVLLQRNGHIIFFIAENAPNPVALIKCLKELADKVVSSCGGIITKTALWYAEAQRLNKIIGFEEYEIYDYYGFYVKVK